MSAVPIDIASQRGHVVAEIAATLRWLHPDGVVWEVRAPRTPGQGTFSGYYDDADKCARDVVATLEGRAPGIYVTLNPVKPELMARACNRLKPRADVTTSDGDIIARCNLLIDFDASRPAGISSTDTEHDAARARAVEVAAYLHDLGWPEPLQANSGNGAHLIYRLEGLPNDAETKRLIERVLQVLATLFDDPPDRQPRIAVDTSVGNAARITKVYGTMVRKGDALPDRPHRRAHVLEAPETLIGVARAQLEAFCALLPESPQPVDAKTRPAANGRAWIDDAGAYLSEHGIPAREHPLPYAQRWTLESCVWDPNHTQSAALLQFPNGVIVARCLHASCADKRLGDFRDAVEPGWRASASSASPLRGVTSTSISEVHDRHFPLIGADAQNHEDQETATEPRIITRRGEDGNFPLLSLADLAKVPHVRPEVLVPGKIMKRSLTITYGNGQTGKSYYAQDTCFELAASGASVWYVAAEGFDGIYLRILAWLATNPGHSLDALRVIPMPVQIFKGGDAHILAAQAQAMPENQRPTLIVLDTLHRCVVGARESDNSDMVCLADKATLWKTEVGAATWVIHHEGKQAGQGMRGASCLFDDADSVQYVFRGGDISVIECEKQKDALPLFEAEAFTLTEHSLDEQGYVGLSAKVLTSLPSEHIVEARRIWKAEQDRRQPGAKNATGTDDQDKLSDKLETALNVLGVLSEEHPAGVFKSTWRARCKDEGVSSGSFDWITKELVRRGRVRNEDGVFTPAHQRQAPSDDSSGARTSSSTKKVVSRPRASDATSTLLAPLSDQEETTWTRKYS